MHILRPLVYVCLLKRYGLRSWRPWLLSLALDLLSQGALQQGQVGLAAGGCMRLRAVASGRSACHAAWHTARVMLLGVTRGWAAPSEPDVAAASLAAGCRRWSAQPMQRPGPHRAPCTAWRCCAA